jgi:hypothetical protein
VLCRVAESLLRITIRLNEFFQNADYVIVVDMLSDICHG